MRRNWTYAESESEFSDNATAGHIRLLTQAPRIPLIFWHNIDALHNCVSGWYINPWGLEQMFDIVDVDVNRSPTAVAFVTPNPAMAGEPVTFDGSSSSDGDGIVNWTWTFDDGGTPVYLWEETAIYTFADDFQTVSVTLTVRDGDGNSDSDTVTLEIVEQIPEYRAVLMPLLAAAIVTMVACLRRRFRL